MQIQLTEVVEHLEVRPHLLPVRFVKKVLIVLLALLGAAASLITASANRIHTDGTFFACCITRTPHPIQDDDCATDSCATLENQLYKTETQLRFPSPHRQLLFCHFPPARFGLKVSNPQTISHVLA